MRDSFAMRCLLAVSVGLHVVGSTNIRGEDWPGWRGPRGDGSSSEREVPLRWDGGSGSNVAWQVPLPGEGHASPIVWGERVFVVACIPEQEQRVLICLNRHTGESLWQQTVLTSPLETKHALNSRASSTPATDGQLVYVSFLEVDGSTIPAPNVGNPRSVTPGEMVVAAYDFEGKRQWRSKPGSFVSAHGYCSCPVLFEDLVIVNGDHDGDSYIVALRKDTGETVWKTPRPHQTRSYVTPLIREVNGQPQLVFSGSKSIVSLNPRDGSMLWQIQGPTEQFVASTVFDGELFFMTAGFPDYHVMGIRPDGRGDVTDTHVAWHQTNARCYVPSPVTVDGCLFVADDRGTVNCFAAATGELLWKERLGSHYSGSAVHVNGLVYLTDDEGVTKIIGPGPKLEVVAENQLGERSVASPAISQGQIFIRGERHLYCIGAEESAAAEQPAQ